MRPRGVMLCALLGLALATLPGIGNPAAAASDALVVWVPEALAPAVRAEVATGFRGRAVTVVPTDVTDLRRALDAAEPGQEPDIVWAPGTATGELVGAGLVERLPLSQVLRDEFPPNVLDAFRFGFAYYGIPVQYENVALVVNRDLVPEALDSFADVERSARRLVNDDTAMVGIAVGQVPDGGAVALGPLFVGLGGYLFGRNPAGSLDPYNVGLNSAEFRSNADAIDRWNRNGLLSASLDDRAAQEAFLGGRAPFWLTGPRSTRVLDRASFAVEVVPVPPIAEGVTPASFVDVSGFMVTAYASQHGALDEAMTLVRRLFSVGRVQSAIAAVTPAAPARREAAMSARAASFAAAATDGPALPNIAQADAVLDPLDRAWREATSGVAARPAGEVFADAQRRALLAVG